MAHGCLDGLATLELALFMRTERPVPAPMDDLYTRVVGVDPSVSQIDHHLIGGARLTDQQGGAVWASYQSTASDWPTPPAGDAFRSSGRADDGKSRAS